MCAAERPDLRNVINNLKRPLPIGKKLGLFMKNSISKITGLKNCCGHPGEPGC